MSEVPPEVLARAQAGDAEAFRVIFEAHIAPVRRFCADLLRDADRADEAAQETFVRAHARLAGLRDGGRLFAWLLGIARLVSLEELRRARRDRSSQGAAGPGAGDGEGEPGSARTAAGGTLAAQGLAGNPELSLLRAEADRALERALAVLSEERRAALLLRVDHGLGYPEIAGALGWSLAKVKNEIHRARLQLREELGGFLEGAA